MLINKFKLGAHHSSFLCNYNVGSTFELFLLQDFYKPLYYFIQRTKTNSFWKLFRFTSLFFGLLAFTRCQSKIYSQDPSNPKTALKQNIDSYLDTLSANGRFNGNLLIIKRRLSRLFLIYWIYK